MFTNQIISKIDKKFKSTRKINFFYINNKKG
jgi:hypothetical protein